MDERTTVRDVAPSGRTVLVVDDHADALTLARRLLTSEGHRVLTAQSGAEALEILERETVQVLLVDHAMPLMDGEELIARVRERDELIQIVLHSACLRDRPANETLLRLPIQGFHDKRDGRERLLTWVTAAFKAYDHLARLRIAERLKLGTVSHEFRTPLNVIVGYVSLLREGTFGPCPPEAQEALGKVLGNAAHLLELTEDLLDIAKLEAGAMTVNPETVELTPFLRQIGESFALLARNKPTAFVTDVPDDLPSITTEAAKLRIVVQNLLSNAEKFTTRGEIRLAARLLDPVRVAIRVSDTGPGIPLEQHEAIFDVFHQLRPHDGNARGAGLGLALARRYARLMEGDITVESIVGEGSAFTVVLPVGVAKVSDPTVSRREFAA